MSKIKKQEVSSNTPSSNEQHLSHVVKTIKKGAYICFGVVAEKQNNEAVGHFSMYSDFMPTKEGCKSQEFFEHMIYDALFVRKSIVEYAVMVKWLHTLLVIHPNYQSIKNFFEEVTEGEEVTHE